jgi:hypothetical protein
LHDNSEKFRASLYVDAAAIFIKHTVQDIKGTKLILQIFGEASGLITNMDKAEFYPIKCQNLNIEQICGADQRLLSLPCKYLGLSLHFKKLPKSMITPMIHKIANRMPGWKRNLLSYPSHELLVKSVLSAIPTFFLTAYKFLNGLPNILIDIGEVFFGEEQT